MLLLESAARSGRINQNEREREPFGTSWINVTPGDHA